jgi:hypothetical protein
MTLVSGDDLSGYPPVHKRSARLIFGALDGFIAFGLMAAPQFLNFFIEDLSK